ncbi:hypothetical protein PVAND_015126 [Polypedilum vanderplanki]|uniref:Uncharacterized protein n=1 Tax=Polypedilum vanderplanki TaxID=319348 RepID=A0A9J6BBS9_POLVA|nr:hypothetical protein PVAND_015126 [Polypedilum vanderplanki]
MNPEENNKTPWQKLTEEQREKIRNSKVFIDNEKIKFCEADELEKPLDSEKFLNSLTQQQIDEILAGAILKFTSEGIFESSSYSPSKSDKEYDEDAGGSKGLKPSRSPEMAERYRKILPTSQPENLQIVQQLTPFELLSDDKKIQIYKAIVKVPGGETEFGLFIDKTGTDNEKRLKICKSLKNEEIEKLLRGDSFTLFEELVESLEDFESDGNFSADQGNSEDASQNQQSRNTQSNNQNNQNSSNNNNDDNNRNKRNDENNESLMEVDGYSAKVYIYGLHDFIKIFLQMRALLILKKEMKDSALKYIFKYLKKENILKFSVLYFYRDFHKIMGSKCLEKIIDEQETLIVQQLKILYGRQLTDLESNILVEKFIHGEIFFMIDNFEFLREIKGGKSKEELTEKLLEILIEIKNNAQKVQIEKNLLLIITDIENVGNRKNEIQTEVYAFERIEVEENFDKLEVSDLQETEYSMKFVLAVCAATSAPPSSTKPPTGKSSVSPSAKPTEKPTTHPTDKLSSKPPSSSAPPSAKPTTGKPIQTSAKTAGSTKKV